MPINVKKAITKRRHSNLNVLGVGWYHSIAQVCVCVCVWVGACVRACVSGQKTRFLELNSPALPHFVLVSCPKHSRKTVKSGPNFHGE